MFVGLTQTSSKFVPYVVQPPLQSTSIQVSKNNQIKEQNPVICTVTCMSWPRHNYKYPWPVLMPGHCVGACKMALSETTSKTILTTKCWEFLCSCDPEFCCTGDFPCRGCCRVTFNSQAVSGGTSVRGGRLTLWLGQRAGEWMQVQIQIWLQICRQTLI